MKNVNIAIIGAGTAGLSARRQLVKETDDYLVFDDGQLGTTCARVGCMPSKVLIQVANDFHRRHHFHEMGIRMADVNGLTVDYKAVMEHVRNQRDRFVRSVMKDMESWENSHLIRARARFIETDILEAGGKHYKVEKTIIATGSKPWIPAEWLPVRHRLIDTDEFFELNDLPKRLAIIGMGVIGIELGQALSRLGVAIKAVTNDSRFGGLTDPDIQNSVLAAMKKEFPIDMTGVQSMSEVTTSTGETCLEITTGSETFEVDAALVAVGRKPILDGLGLEHLNIETAKNGQPLLEKGRFKVKGTNIYLVGDVNGERPLLHEASDEGRIAGYNAAAGEEHCFQQRTSLAITFTEPNIALVGQSFKALSESRKNFVTGAVSFRGQGRAIVKNMEVGDLHVYADAKDGRILGAELFAPDGEHHAHLLAWAIESKLTVHEALAMPFYHPVTEEGLRTALRDAALKIPQHLSALELLRCSDPPVK